MKVSQRCGIGLTGECRDIAILPVIERALNIDMKENLRGIARSVIAGATGTGDQIRSLGIGICKGDVLTLGEATKSFAAAGRFPIQKVCQAESIAIDANQNSHLAFRSEYEPAVLRQRPMKQAIG